METLEIIIAVLVILVILFVVLAPIDLEDDDFDVFED